MEAYTTVAQQAQDEFIERKSRFIGTIRPVRTEEEAVAFISEMREKYRDATHNVYAYSLREGQMKRFSDDGEPSGTAGKPVLEVILKENLVDVAVVVTRYFGGILLGAGGLLRAYTQGAKCAVDAAEVLHMCPAVRFSLSVDYGFYGKLTYILPKYGIVTESSDFGAEISMVFRIRSELLPAFAKELRDLSCGAYAPEIMEEFCTHFDPL